VVEDERVAEEFVTRLMVIMIMIMMMMRMMILKKLPCVTREKLAQVQLKSDINRLSAVLTAFKERGLQFNERVEDYTATLAELEVVVVIIIIMMHLARRAPISCSSSTISRS